MPKFYFSNNKSNNIITGSGWVICKSEPAARRVVALFSNRNLQAKDAGKKFAYDIELDKNKVLFTYRGVFDRFLAFDPLEAAKNEYKKGRLHFIVNRKEVLQVTLNDSDRPIRVARILKEEGEETDD